MKRGLKFLAFGGGAIVATGAALIAVATLTGDPFDRFEVLSTSISPDGRRYAHVVTYHHSNSSTEWNAVWLSNQSKTTGSKERLSGSPAAVWAGTDAQLIWRDDRPFLAVATTVARRSPAQACYFDYEVRPIACFDAAKIAVVDR